jgi:hypothetical protein
MVLAIRVEYARGSKHAWLRQITLPAWYAACPTNSEVSSATEGSPRRSHDATSWMMQVVQLPQSASAATTCLHSAAIRSRSVSSAQRENVAFT